MEQRFTDRTRFLSISLPIRVRSLGIMSSTDQHFEAGAAIEVLVRMLVEIIGPPLNDWLCTGQADRTKEHIHLGRRFSICVRFLSYEEPSLAGQATQKGRPWIFC